ncbi:Selenocysteine-specific elongation factor [Methanimicrococcus hongohii]|uniref:Selenocysteine-specific elongation factor n=1 Tax=Methanimicrococcus hongohii TaxID=3028295 RepID=A0AA96V021_9EURY|nr:EF-Tu/IF-2/RF-3 family GTPase [Methanimicrococcus sp. Hf6]WNY23874.1 Selenocysteine-specific elongation factor [Methanimicrococcus sp. Hf6]
MTNIAIIGDEQSGRTSLGSKLGKKGTDSDITLFNDDRHEQKYVYIDAKSYPKSMKSIVAALNLSDMAILCVTPNGLTPIVGECMVALDLLQFKRGIIAITKSDTSYAMEIDAFKEKLQKITAGTVLENWEVVALNTNKDAPNAFEGIDELKEQIHKLGGEIEAEQRTKDGLPPRVVIDHFFNVTGIGIVILGKVLQGTIHTHDKIGLYPVDKKVDIRSIQTHDVDVKETGTGSRVGVGLKGLLERELERGFLLSNSEIVASEFEMECTLSKFAKGGVQLDDVLHLFVGLQSDPVRVKKITVGGVEKEMLNANETGILKLEGGKKIAYSKEDLFLFASLEENQRFTATGKVV